MPYFDLPVSEALNELGITKTKKSVLFLDQGSFNEEEGNFSFIRGELTNSIEIDDWSKVLLGGVFGISKGYAKKLPWDLFVENINHWAPEGRVLLEWLQGIDSNNGQLIRAVSAEKTILTRDNLLDEYFNTLSTNYRLRWMTQDKDTLYIDVQLSTPEEDSQLGVRLIADLSLKKGLNLYGLLNMDNTLAADGTQERPNWAPVVITESFKVKTRGLDALEVYEEIQTNFKDISTSIQGQEKLAFAGDYFTYDYHIENSLKTLALSRQYGLGSRFISKRFPFHTDNDTLVAAFVGMAIVHDWTGSKPTDIHNYQRFFGDILVLPNLVKTCSFCLSKMDIEDE